MNIVGDGNQTRSFTYIDDGINALEQIIINQSNNLDGKIFNIGNQKGYNIPFQLPELNNQSTEMLLKEKITSFSQKFFRKALDMKPIIQIHIIRT